MFELTADQSAIATSIIANIVLNISIQLQKYTKRKIIYLALHGLPSVSVERLWQVALSLLVIAECTYYVWYGLDRNMAMTPMGVYTTISNSVLPPLLFECQAHTLAGTTCAMIGVLILIVIPSPLNSSVEIVWNASTERWLVFYLATCLIFCIIRAYKPANCSLKLTVNCGLSALLGAFSVAFIKILFYSHMCENHSDIKGVCEYAPLIWALIVIIFILQLVILSENLEYFPVWQVVPHHYILFSMFVFSSSAGIFHQFEYNEAHTIYVAALAHILILVGIWVSAKPHLDIPASINHSTLMPHLEAFYSQKYNRSPDSAERAETRYAREEEHHCVKEMYCSLMRDILRSNQGFSFHRSNSLALPNSVGPSRFYSRPEEEP